MLKRSVGRKIDEFSFLMEHWGCKKKLTDLSFLYCVYFLMSKVTFGSVDFYYLIVP